MNNINSHTGMFYVINLLRSFVNPFACNCCIVGCSLPFLIGMGFIKLYEMIANDFVYADPMNLMVFPDNHDMSRIFSLLHDDLDLWKASVLFTATTRGIPQFYYGTEVLTKSPIERNDGLLRADFPGGWKSDKANAFTGTGLGKQQREAQAYLKALLQWRKHSTAISNGKLMHYLPENGHYVYFRYDQKSKVMVILNKNKQSSVVDLTRFASMIGTARTGFNPLKNSRVDLTKPLVLDAGDSLLIEY